MAKSNDGSYPGFCEICGGGFLGWTPKRRYCDKSTCRNKASTIKRFIGKPTVDMEQFRRSELVRALEESKLS